MKLSNYRLIGRYINPETKRLVNVRQGRNMQKGTDHLFYIFRGKRVFVSMADFYSGKWAKIIN